MSNGKKFSFVQDLLLAILATLYPGFALAAPVKSVKLMRS